MVLLILVISFSISSNKFNLQSEFITTNICLWPCLHFQSYKDLNWVFSSENKEYIAHTTKVAYHLDHWITDITTIRCSIFDFLYDWLHWKSQKCLKSSLLNIVESGMMLVSFQKCLQKLSTQTQHNSPHTNPITTIFLRSNPVQFAFKNSSSLQTADLGC